MKVRQLYFCLFFLIGLSAPKFLYGQVERFQQGEIKIAFGTNITTPDGNKYYFTNENSATLDFAGEESPQVKVVFQNLKWKSGFGEGEHYFVVRNAWINDANGILDKVTKSNLKTKSKAKRTINFKGVKNGKVKIIIEYGIMGPEEGGKLEKVKRAGTFTKEFTLTGVGAPAKTAEEPSPTPTPPPPVATTPIKTTPSKPIVSQKPPEIVVEKDQEEEFWKDVQAAKSYSMYKTYLKEFSEGKYVDDAKKGLRGTKIKFDILEGEERGGGTYFYKIKIIDAENIQIGSYDQEQLRVDVRGDIVEVVMLSPEPQKLAIRGDYSRTVEVPLNPDIKLFYANFVEYEDYVEYEIGGGEPPYFIRLVDALTDRWVCDNQKLATSKEQVTKGKIIKEEWMANNCVGLDGQYKIEVQDRTKTLTKYNDGIYTFKGETSNALIFVLIFLILVPLIGGIMLFMSNKAKEKKRLEYEEKLKKKKAEAAAQKAAAPAAKPTEEVKPIPIADPREKTDEIPSLENIPSDAAQKMKINVKRKETQKSSKKANGQGRSKGKTTYLDIPMSAKWENSAIADVSMSKSTIVAIDDFIRTENRTGIDEDNSAVPEIGGFLLGNYEFDEGKEQYQVFLEKFVPITPDQNDVYKVEFGANAWLELDTVKDDYPDYVIIGWFHTHPGHSLFLSQPDLKIHEGFFKQRFQLAMEIDTLSENLDTGFFTRTKEGVINNTRDAIPNSGWFSWSDIEKFRRKK